MNLARISFSHLRARPWSTALNLILLALAVATVVVIVLVSAQLEERLERDAQGIDLVIGPKGSALQIVLSSLYQLDAPGGTMRWADAERVAGDPGVRKVIPILLADNYWGFRIVGTTHDYIAQYGGQPAAGRLWQAPFEAVLGADVATRMRAVVGGTFIAGHGVRASRAELHESDPYRVVGVLHRTGSVIDRLVLTDMSSIARSHVPQRDAEETGLVTEPPPEDMREVTALLVQAVTPEDAEALAMRLNAEGELQAALPGSEVRRIFRFIGVGADVMWAFALVLMLSAGLSVFIALFNQLNERRQDLAIMRALGAGGGRLMALLLFEGLTLAALGAALGLALGHALTGAIGLALTRAHQVSLTGWTWNRNEPWIIVLALLVGLVAALVPAWRARRIDIAGTLARH